MHPQLHLEEYPWAPCIPRRPLDPAEFDRHPYWTLWLGARLYDYTILPGIAFSDRGVMSEQTWLTFAPIVRQVSNLISTLASSRCLPPHMTVAQSAMNSTLDRLKSLPMSYHDLVLQTAQCLRMALDVLGMHSFITKYMSCMLQRAYIHKLDDTVLGCFTNNPTTVENMFYVGIPVFYICEALHTPPFYLRIKSIVRGHHVPFNVINDEWFDPDARIEKPCKILHFGPHGAARHLMSRTLGHY